MSEKRGLPGLRVAPGTTKRPNTHLPIPKSCLVAGDIAGEGRKERLSPQGSERSSPAPGFARILVPAQKLRVPHRNRVRGPTAERAIREVTWGVGPRPYGRVGEPLGLGKLPRLDQFGGLPKEKWSRAIYVRSIREEARLGGFEKEPDYAEIARNRIAYWKTVPRSQAPTNTLASAKKPTVTLASFDGPISRPIPAIPPSESP
jgi:hypothetical protein